MDFSNGVFPIEFTSWQAKALRKGYPMENPHDKPFYITKRLPIVIPLLSHIIHTSGYHTSLTWF